MRPPNVLFLYTDEQRYNTLACYGNEQIQMPNLNRFAETATVFDQAYVTQPVCTPSRSTLLTGLYPHTNGCLHNNIPLPAHIPCLPEMIQGGDYATGHHGKWHLGDEIFSQHGFDDWVSSEDGYAQYYGPGRDREARSSYHHYLVDQGFTPQDGSAFARGEAARLPEAHGKPAFLAREASRFLRENRDRPFMLFVNFLEPHMPFYGPRDGQYDPSQVPLPPNFYDVPTLAQPAKVLARYYAHREPGGGALRTEAEWRDLIARYWGLCSLVDTHMGTILDTLEELGLAENTIVVYTSDHGDMMGSHQLVAKGVMYQESVRVPLLIRYPGQRRGHRVTGPISQVDVVPTLLDLMGQAIPAEVQGQSRRASVEGEARSLEEDVFIQWRGRDGASALRQMPRDLSEERLRASNADPVRTIITADGWRFSCSVLGEHELYNLRQDPGETVNLAMHAQHRPLMGELRRRIVRWQERVGDTLALPEL